jgi:uncharacterized protein
MKIIDPRAFYLLALTLTLSACVTVNITFPPAAAQQAADQIIDKVWQKDPEPQESPPETESAPPAVDQRSHLWQQWGTGLINIFIPNAHAAPNFNISTPAIKALQERMAQRHKNLEPHYDSGAVGLSHDGFILLRDGATVALNQRGRVNTWISEENSDRDALYTEIATANGHPEWKKDIQNTFAERWISRAQKGWWYQNKQGNWIQK